LGLPDNVQGGLWSWGLNRYGPFTFIAFLIYYIGALAETNRTPFDIPEAESELVAGYHTEYSGMRFSSLPFRVREHVRVSAIRDHVLPRRLAASVPQRHGRDLLDGRRRGAWRPWPTASRSAVLTPRSASSSARAWACWPRSSWAPTTEPHEVWLMPAGIARSMEGMMWFSGKCFALIFLMIWLRWTLPRYRVDQLMDLCWKKLTPLAFINLLVIGILETGPIGPI